MLTELQKRKWTRLFQVYDRNNNGFVEKSDFETVFQNLAQARSLDPTSPEYAQIHDKFMENWTHFRENIRSSEAGKINLDEWLAHGAQRIENPSKYQTIVDLANQIFELFDLDSSGAITVDEYKKIISSWDVSEAVAQENFPKLDLNGDGQISKQEYVELLRQFHMSNNPDEPGNLFFGPY